MTSPRSPVFAGLLASALALTLGGWMLLSTARRQDDAARRRVERLFTTPLPVVERAAHGAGATSSSAVATRAASSVARVRRARRPSPRPAAITRSSR